MNDGIAVIGGGAAGMLAAVTAAGRGKKVTLFEKNRITGRKLLITGKGRCNVTNNCDTDELIRNVAVNGRFLYSAFSAFTPADLMSFFETRGVRLKTERGRRVFPESDRSADIVTALRTELNAAGVGTVFETVKAVRPGFSVVTESGSHSFGAVIIATGGLSYPLTGSTGDGYRFAKSLGHAVTPTRPALVSVNTAERWVCDAAGLSLKNVGLSCVFGGKTVFKELGEMLFTHNGVSGPMVLTLSSILRPDMLGKTNIFIDMKPALDAKTLDARLLRDFGGEQNRELKNVLRKLLPEAIITPVLRLSEIDGAKPVNSVTSSERSAIVSAVKAIPLTPSSLGDYDEAVITSGGVCVKEIDPHTMQSKLVPGLYFAGEVIDVDAFTGGYNLQIAFSTGRLAGLNV